MYEAGLGNTLKGFISAFAVSDDVKIVCNYNNPLGFFDTVLKEEHIGNIEDRISFSSCRFLILKEEENIQQDLNNEYSKYNEIDLNEKSLWPIFSKKVMIDWYFDRSLINDQVFNRIQSYMEKIKWNQIILDEVEKYVKKFDFPTLGISVRSWNSHHPGDRGCRRPYDSKVYTEAIINVLQKNSEIKTIFISYDNLKYQNEYKDVLNYHNTITYERPNYINDIQYSVINMLILSKCNFYICNRISTFAELVFWFSKCSQQVTTVY